MAEHLHHIGRKLQNYTLLQLLQGGAGQQYKGCIVQERRASGAVG